MQLKKFDVGMFWGSIINIWGQVGVVFGIANTIMLLGVFYTTTARAYISFPLYIVIVVVLGTSTLAFILKVGISGYYRFFTKQTSLSKVDEKLDNIIKDNKLIKAHLGIVDKDAK